VVYDAPFKIQAAEIKDISKPGAGVE